MNEIVVKVSPCPKCGVLPIQESKRETLGKISDGGYDITIGRFVCPKCGAAPSWGQAYCVDDGWEKSAEVWNAFVAKIIERIGAK